MQYVEPIEAGDKVGGARVDLSIKNSGFSYAGQGSKRSSQERRSGRVGGHRPARSSSPAPATPSETGARRMTAAQAAKEKTSKVYTGRV